MSFTTSMLYLILFIAFLLFTHANSLSNAYKYGPITLSTRAQLWYSTQDDFIHLAISIDLSFGWHKYPLWVGLGVAAPGSVGMRGADLFTVQFPPNGLECGQARDRHAPFIKFSQRMRLSSDQVAPTDTETDNVWTLRRCPRYLNGTIILEVTRSVNVKNLIEDAPIVPGATRVLHAYGIGNLSVHAQNNRNSTEIVFLAPSPSSRYTNVSDTNSDTWIQTHIDKVGPSLPPDVSGSFTFQSGSFRVTGNNLTCFTTLHDIPEGSMVVAITPHVTSKAVVRVVLYGCKDTRYFKNMRMFKRRCALTSYTSGTEASARCSTLFYSWAPGVDTLILPPEAGFHISSLNRRLLMELTFDKSRGGYSTGDVRVQLHFTRKPRRHHAGTLAFGNAAHDWYGILVENVTTICVSECTRYWKLPINMFALHMHLGKYGRSVRMKRMGENDTVKQDLIDQVPFWAPHLERLKQFDVPVVIKPRERLLLDCNVFETPELLVRYGRRVSTEQCEALGFYWPSQARKNDEDGSLFYCARGYGTRGLPVAICGAGWRAERIIEDDVCFPGDAQIELRNGYLANMAQLRVGDEVLVAPGIYSKVYMFTHRQPNVLHSFVVLEFVSKQRTKSFAASTGHMIYVNDQLKQAGLVRPRDILHDKHGNRVPVVRVARRFGAGLFNPHTLHGDIIVDGIRSTSNTHSVHFVVAQALLAPFRALFRTSGIDAGTKIVCGPWAHLLIQSTSATIKALIEWIELYLRMATTYVSQTILRIPTINM